MSEAVGKKLFITRCGPCHSMEEGGKAKIGPNLFKIYNKRSCMEEGYNYSEELKLKGYVWNEENLHKFLEDPKKNVAGTRMLFAGLKKAQEREDVIAFFKKMAN